MLTTRDLVTRLLATSGSFLCPEGVAFIDAHPDPLEAIEYALAHAVDPSTFTSELDFEEFYSADPDKRGETGAFLRYLASEDALLGVEARYGDWRAPDHLQKCADTLRAWVVAQIGEVQT